MNTPLYHSAMFPALVFADWKTFSVLRLSAFRCWLYCLLCASGKVNSFSWVSVSSAVKLRPCSYLPQRFLEGLDNQMSVKYLTQCPVHCKCSVNTYNIYYNHTYILWPFYYLSVFPYSLSDLNHPAILGGRSYCVCFTYAETKAEGN